MIPKTSILLNGEERFVNNNITIAFLVEELGLDIKKIAIEKNYEIVFPNSFSQNILKNGDRIEIVHFIGGG
jgi:thiamine biosynthesis protein ThiS